MLPFSFRSLVLLLSVVEAILVIGSDGFKCINPENDQLLVPEYSYKYSEISVLLLRVRPEHMDIRYKSKLSTCSTSHGEPGFMKILARSDSD